MQKVSFETSLAFLELSMVLGCNTEGHPWVL